MDKDTLLGPLCTKQRLEGLRSGRNNQKKEVSLLGGRGLQILIKAITMNQLYLMM